MGTLTITTRGSFDGAPQDKRFTAITHGHAHAVAEAIQYLSQDVLPLAIQKDHALHDAEQKPEEGFERP